MKKGKSEDSREKEVRETPGADCFSTAASLLICMLYISEHLYLCFVLYRHETRAELLCCVPVTMMKDDEKDAWINVQSLQARLSDRFYLSYKYSVSPPA